MWFTQQMLVIQELSCQCTINFILLKYGFRNNGTQSSSLTKDHKPSEDFERKRIIANGGQLYQNNQILHTLQSNPTSVNVGPVRVLPGRLSVQNYDLFNFYSQVSRTFGDAHAKIEQYGGNPKVVVAVPDITHFKLLENYHDFILIASDGVFDRLTTEETINLAWQFNSNNHSIDNNKSITNLNEACG